MPLKDRAKRLEYQNNYYKANKEAHKWRCIKRDFGISKEDYLNLLNLQNNKCKLCDKLLPETLNRSVHVDHCHETDKIRGILCMPCNVALGMLGDNEKGISKALRYVKGEF